MKPSEAILRMLDHDEDLALYAGRQIKKSCGWDLSDDQARDRIMQCLRRPNRNFHIDWYPILADIFRKHHVPDMVSPIIHEAFLEADYKIKRAPMAKVHADRRERRFG